MTSTTRARQKAETRERILTAAADQFALTGFLGTSTVEVAHVAGVSHGSVFAHFLSRDALIADVISRLADTVVRRIHDRVEQGASLEDALRAHVAGLADVEPLYARLVTEGPSLPSAARNALIGIQSATAFHLEPALRNERLATSLPLSFVFNAWLGLVNHYVSNRDLFAPGESVLLARGEDLIKQFITLLRGASRSGGEE